MASSHTQFAMMPRNQQFKDYLGDCVISLGNTISVPDVMWCNSGRTSFSTLLALSLECLHTLGIHVITCKRDIEARSYTVLEASAYSYVLG